MVRGVSAADMDNEFVSDKIKLRGKVYTITELSMKAYDKTVKQATREEDDDGIKREIFDGAAHNKLLMAACVKVDGEKADVDDIYSQGTRLVRALQKKINSVHFDDEPEEEIEDGEGEAKAEAKS